MSVVHIVELGLKAEVPEEKRNEFVQKTLDLQKDCKKENGSTYIKTATGGRRNFSLGFGEGAEPSHAFVFTFESIEDRDYFLQKDEAHHAFFGFADPLVNTVTAFDYTIGEP